MKRLFLDDWRNCPEGFDLARNYDEFVDYIERNGVPNYISFDHDLGSYDKTGYDCALYLVKNDLKINDFSCHSANPIGRKRIYDLLTDWKDGIKPKKLEWDNH